LIAINLGQEHVGQNAAHEQKRTACRPAFRNFSACR
jgi:hypothetical protein